MGSIPVLNDNQMNALRRIVGANQTFDLTVAPRGKSRRLPENAEEAVSDSEYNGYFKIVDASEYDEETGELIAFGIGVVDGATYDPEAGTSGPSYAQINGISVPVNAFVDEISTGVTTFVELEYIEATGQTDIVLSAGALLPSDDSQLHTLIGRVYFVDGAMYIEQAHVSGVITMNCVYRGGFKLLVTPGELGDEILGSVEDNECKLTGGYVDALRQTVQETEIDWTGNIYFNVLYDVASSQYNYSVTQNPVAPTDKVRSVSIRIGSFNGNTAVQYFNGNSITLAGDYVI